MVAHPLKLIFIGGSMRTGTTLLQSVLCSSPDTHPLVNECHYLNQQMQVYARYNTPSNPFIIDYFGDLNRFQHYTRQIISEFLKIFYERLTPKKALVLKNPGITKYFPDLAELFPEALFLISVRDPRDTIASMIDVAKKQIEMKQHSILVTFGRDMEKLCAYYNDYYINSINTLKNSNSSFSRRTTFLKYEDLVLNTDEIIQKIEQTCQIDLGNFTKNSTWNAVKGYFDIPQNDIRYSFCTELDGQGISSSSIGRYRQCLTRTEIQKIDYFFADLYKMWRYKKDSLSSPF